MPRPTSSPRILTGCPPFTGTVRRNRCRGCCGAARERELSGGERGRGGRHRARRPRSRRRYWSVGPGYGGLGDAPKFPPAGPLEFAIARYIETGDAGLRSFVVSTLDGMSLGELYDKVEGGFFSYATARDWSAPHYEKMLSDNAELIYLYLAASVVFDRQDYAETARGALDYSAANPAGRRAEGLLRQPGRRRDVLPPGRRRQGGHGAAGASTVLYTRTRPRRCYRRWCWRRRSGRPRTCWRSPSARGLSLARRLQARRRGMSLLRAARTGPPALGPAGRPGQLLEGHDRPLPGYDGPALPREGGGTRATCCSSAL